MSKGYWQWTKKHTWYGIFLLARSGAKKLMYANTNMCMYRDICVLYIDIAVYVYMLHIINFFVLVRGKTVGEYYPDTTKFERAHLVIFRSIG